MSSISTNSYRRHAACFSCTLAQTHVGTQIPGNSNGFRMKIVALKRKYTHIRSWTKNNQHILINGMKCDLLNEKAFSVVKSFSTNKCIKSSRANVWHDVHIVCLLIRFRPASTQQFDLVLVSSNVLWFAV